MATERSEEFDLRHLVTVVRNRAWIPILLAVLAAVAAYVLAGQAPSIYEAKAQARITDPNADSVFGAASGGARTDPDREVDTQIQLIKSNSMRRQVDEKLGDASDEIESVTISNVSGTDLVVIAVSSQSPQVAMDAANAYANLFVENRRNQLVKTFEVRADELRASAADLNAQLLGIDTQIADEFTEPSLIDSLRAQRSEIVVRQAEFQRRAGEFEVEAATRAASIQFVIPADLPTVPVSPKPLRDAALAGVLALLVGVGLVFLLERLNDRVTSVDDIPKITGGTPVLGTIPIYAPNKKRGTRHLPKNAQRTLVPLDSQAAEAYRTLRTSLRFSNFGKEKRVIMVTSSVSGEGKSTVTANLAVALAESGQRVVVVSADLRRPTIAGFFELPENADGLTSALLDDAALRDCVLPIGLESGHRLYVLPSGPLPHNPAELLGSDWMGKVLQNIKNADVDFVLVDCAPVLPVSDPLAIAQYVDGVVLITLAGSTHKHQLAESVERLNKVGATIIGVVVNGASTAGSVYGDPYTDRYEAAPNRLPASRGTTASPASPILPNGHVDPQRSPADTAPTR